MNPSYEIWRGVEGVAGPAVRRPNRKFEILAKDFTSVEQAVPVPVVYGRVRLAATQITPVFGFRNEKIETKTGKDAK